MNANNQKSPRVVVGAFIFNEKNELFMMKTVQWKNKYTVPGGGLEAGEELEEAVRREVKEETNMDMEDLEYIRMDNAHDVGKEYLKEDKHLLFIDFKARVKGDPKIKLNKEAVGYKWLKLDDWIAKGEKFFPHKYIFQTLKDLAEDNYNFEEKYKRALADYQNLLKRSAEEKKEFAKYAQEEFLMEILPVYDNLKMSLKFSDKEAEGNGWAKGVEYVVNQFKDALKNLGVEEIKIKKGDSFDHSSMEALEGKGEKVKKVVKAGYRLKEKVIVPAKVIVE